MGQSSAGRRADRWCPLLARSLSFLPPLANLPFRCNLPCSDPLGRRGAPGLELKRQPAALVAAAAGRPQHGESEQRWRTRMHACRKTTAHQPVRQSAMEQQGQEMYNSPAEDGWQLPRGTPRC